MENVEKRYQQFFADSKKYEWPTNLAYAVFGEEGLNFTQDQLDGLYYAIDQRQQWINNNEEKSFIYAYFKDGMALKHIAKQYGIGDGTVKNRLLKGLRYMRHPVSYRYIKNGLTGWKKIEAELCKEQEERLRIQREKERYFHEHPFERDLEDFMEKADLSEYYKSLIQSGIKTMSDVVNNINYKAKAPYGKLQRLMFDAEHFRQRGCTNSDMKKFVNTLREDFDVPPFDGEERAASVDREKVLEDYTAAKALNLFTDDEIFKALRNKYCVSLDILTNLVGKSQTMQQNGCLTDLIDEAEKRPKQPTLNEKFREVGRNGGLDGVGVKVRGDDRDR